MTTTVETFACHDCQLLSPSAQRMPAARLLCRIRLPLQHASPVLLHPSHSWHRHHEGQTIPVLPGPHWHGLLHLPLGKKHHLHLCLGHRLHLGTLRSPPPPSRETPIGRLACCVWPRRALVRPTAVARCAWQCACHVPPQGDWLAHLPVSEVAKKRQLPPGLTPAATPGARSRFSLLQPYVSHPTR